MRTTARRTATTRTNSTATRSTRHSSARALHRSLTVAGLAGLGVPLLAASALAAGVPPVLPLSVGTTVTTSATGTTGAVADVALQPLRTTAGSLRLCPGDVTTLGVQASAGSLTVVRPRAATAGWATSVVGGTGVSTPGLGTTLREAERTSASAGASSSGVRADVDAPVVSSVVRGVRVDLPRLSLQSAVAGVREDVRTAVGFLPTVTAAVDAGARGAAVTADGPLALGLTTAAGRCVDLDWQLLG